MDKQRTTDWRSRLAAHIEANRLRPFEWGQHDCALWAASAHEVVWGVDVGEPYRGTYSTPAGALKAMLKIDGVSTPDEVAVLRFGPRKNVAKAMCGDVVAADLSAMGIGEAEGLSLGVCFGATSFFVSDTGLVALRTLSLEHAYG